MYWNAFYGHVFKNWGKFNNNIRCIEIDSCDLAMLLRTMFNNNIRCIEMYISNNARSTKIGLITT